MSEKKVTKKEQDAIDEPNEQAAIDEQCEALCDEVHEVSQLQAKILRATYRDKLDDGAMRRITGMPADAIQRERAAALRTALNIATGGMLQQWSTPEARNVPKPGEGATTAADEETEGAAA